MKVRMVIAMLMKYASVMIGSSMAAASAIKINKGFAIFIVKASL
jgi:hypothetical protein